MLSDELAWAAACSDGRRPKATSAIRSTAVEKSRSRVDCRWRCSSNKPSSHSGLNARCMSNRTMTGKGLGCTCDRSLSRRPDCQGASANTLGRGGSQGPIGRGMAGAPEGAPT